MRAAAGRYPARIAIADESGAMEYATLLAAVARLADAIARTHTTGPVGIMLPSSAACAVAVFATLAAGRVGVVLDMSYPPARNAAIAAATGITLVLAAHSDADPLATTLDVAASLDPAAPIPPLPRAFLDLDAPAYILCTSGSSGAVKPIAHSQRTMLHWSRTTHNGMHIRPDDRVLSLSSFATLGGATALLTYPLAGACIQVFDLKAGGLRGLLDILATRPVTILRGTPSLLRTIAALPEARPALSRLRLAQLYGEPLLKRDLAELRRVLPAQCFVRSTYGSTEASGLIWFAGDPDEHHPHRVASGTLMPDTAAAIVDDDGAPCRPGQAGELWIRSRYNALGEWRDGAVIPGPLQPDPADPTQRIFRSGDIARFHPDGVFVIVGRKDRMIKLNGQRVEPAEIEAALRASPGVALAEVVLQQGRAGAELLAFVVPRAPSAPGLATALRQSLRATLPSFMVPSRIVLVPAIPLLPGGKPDHAALLATLP